MLVSVLIVQQGWGITMTSFKQLTDAGVSPETKSSLLLALQPLLPGAPRTLPRDAAAPRAEQLLLAVEDLRATRAGSLMFVDLTAKVPRSLNVADTSALEKRIGQTLKQAKKEVKEVRLHSGSSRLMIACLTASRPSSGRPLKFKDTSFVKQVKRPRNMRYCESVMLSATVFPGEP